MSGGGGDLDETKQIGINNHWRGDGYSGAPTVLSASVDVSNFQLKNKNK